ncbi:hypothetical protein [Mesorhizobium salmacidum]|uniref:Uncharacterized protein n=1 Tax=Mesorhizobium salmacidum TaxID=3015171 RepID=A0ABU8L1Y8_9HYPH
MTAAGFSLLWFIDARAKLDKGVRQDEARRVRALIAELERNLTAASAQIQQLRPDAGHELRNSKFRLDRLEAMR